MEWENSKKEMAEAAYERGDIAFKAGRYQEAVKEMTRCLGIEKSKEYIELESMALNALGMLFAFTGYEACALDHYLSAFEAAGKNQDTNGQVSSLLNVGLLYQGKKEYAKAMEYYRRAKEIAEGELRGSQILLVLYCNIQIAQLLCRMGRFGEAVRMHRDIENYYSATLNGDFLLTKSMLDIYLEEKKDHFFEVEELYKEVIHNLEHDTDFMEQIDCYIDICEFALERDKQKEARQLLDILEEKMRPTEFLRLQLRIEEMEVQYRKKYHTNAEYQETCKNYMILYQEYEETLKVFRRQNLENIEQLKNLEMQRWEAEKRSKFDSVTGLLNKKAFQQEIELYLQERSRYVTDAMAFLDIDNFKLVNDSFGAQIGDEIIKMLAERIKDFFNGDCIYGRFGGDEFAVFFKNVQEMEKLEEQIEHFRQDFSKHGFGKHGDIYVTISIGVSYNYEIKASYQSLISCADEALEKAKEYGKNRVTFFEIKRGIYKYV